MDQKVTLSLYLFFILLNLSACQSGQIQKCKSFNWRSYGVQSAVLGKTKQDSFEVQKASCSQFDIHADELSFNEGYTRGLAQFCTTPNGYEFGEQGAKYQSTCSSQNQQAFLKGFYKGRIEHLQAELSKHKSLYSEAEDRLWRKEREYLIIQNEDPEQAKLEVDVIDAYREEAKLLAQKKRDLKKELIKTKKLSEESYF